MQVCFLSNNSGTTAVLLQKSDDVNLQKHHSDIAMKDDAMQHQYHLK